MVTGTKLVDRGKEFYAEVFTDSGGDQSYGPFASAESALDVLVKRLNEDFDTEFDPTTHVVERLDADSNTD